MPKPAPEDDCRAIIVAAGSSRRMGFDKLAVEIEGTPVLQRTLAMFLAAESISGVVIVCPEERWPLLGALAMTATRVDGGESRQDSVAAGLAALPESTRWVAIHDGARPLITPEAIDLCVATAKEHGAAALARRVTETLKRSDTEDFSAKAVSREQLWFMETPQVFEVELLKKAYAEVAARSLSVTDEVSALEAIGVKTKLVESPGLLNLKITTPADLALATSLLQ